LVNLWLSLWCLLYCWYMYTNTKRFNEINFFSLILWFFLGYLEQGLIVRDIGKLRKHYIQSRAFILDIISLLPTDFLYFIPKLYLLPALRFNRLFRIYRTLEFSDKVETQTNHPNVFRLVSLLIIILIIIHWNACFYFIISRWIGYSTDGWVYNMTTPTATTLTTQYLYCFFWSTLVLTNIGEVPPPETDVSWIDISLIKIYPVTCLWVQWWTL